MKGQVFINYVRKVNDSGASRLLLVRHGYKGGIFRSQLKFGGGHSIDWRRWLDSYLRLELVAVMAILIVVCFARWGRASCCFFANRNLAFS